VALYGLRAKKAINRIQALAENAQSENVKLKAKANLLDRAGWQSVVKNEFTETSDIENMADA
jgi:hypothetical protein|tara:strand:+ start:131 stop:316 length:186 start_codon:yes stop_codon:yes gene_type:complete